MGRRRWLHALQVCLRYARRLAIAFVLVWPTLLITFDHHGVERIPTHEHLMAPGESPPLHAHGFEQEHAHSETRAADPAASNIHTYTAPSSAAALAFAETIVLLPVVLGLIFAPAGRRPFPRRHPFVDQIAMAPPTPPPPALLTW